MTEFLHGKAEPAELRALAWRLVGPAFAAHLAEQDRWPERTDADRLTDAFRTLDMSGIVAREDFACCQNCGTTEIADERGKDQAARGYVFYHAQDAERMADGGSLWLAFGGFAELPDEQIGVEIAAALRAEGLQVDWDGSAGRRIHVRLDWKRRRFGRLAAHVAYDPAEPEVTATIDLGRRVRSLDPMPVTALAAIELPWLPTGATLEVEAYGSTQRITRDGHRLLAGDRATGRFDGLRLLRGDDVPGVPNESGILDVTYEALPSGPIVGQGQPMTSAEVIDVLRRLPTRTGSWLSASSPSGAVVQLSCDDGRLWLETPHPEDATATGKHATLVEAERMLTILAAEDRSAVAELDGVTRQPW